MRHRVTVALVVAGLAALALTVPAQAGGWATVTLDRLPTDVRAGESAKLGFMVRQHGETPVNFVKPYLVARYRDSGDQVRANARQEGAVGHFAVEVTFPKAGAWEWEITPEPFEGTKFAPLQVAAGSSAKLDAATEAQAPAVRPAAADEGGFLRSAVLRWGGALALIAAAALALIHQRRAVRRWLAARSR